MVDAALYFLCTDGPCLIWGVQGTSRDGIMLIDSPERALPRKRQEPSKMGRIQQELGAHAEEPK